MLHAHGTRTQSRGRADRGSGEGTANYGFGVQLPGRGQPGGNPVPLAPGPFAGGADRGVNLARALAF